MSDDKDTNNVPEIDCEQAINDLYAYLDGEVSDPSTIAKFEHHLEHCQSCYSRTQLESTLSQVIHKSGQMATPDSLRNRLKKLIEDI